MSWREWVIKYFFTLPSWANRRPVQSVSQTITITLLGTTCMARSTVTKFVYIILRGQNLSFDNSCTLQKLCRPSNQTIYNS